MQGDLRMAQGRLEGAPAELLEDFLDGFQRDSRGILEWIYEIGDFSMCTQWNMLGSELDISMG